MIKKLVYIIVMLGCFFGFTQDSISYYNEKIKQATTSSERAFLFQKKITILKNQDDLEEYYYAHFDHYLLAPTLENISVLQDADKNVWREPKNVNEQLAKLHVLVNIGYHSKEFGAISESVTAYEKAWLYYEEQDIEHYDIIAYCLKPLANNYMRLGDYNRAEAIIKNTIGILEKNKNESQLIKVYLNLVNLYTLTKEHHKANELLKSLLANFKIDAEQKSDIYTQIATNFYELNDPINADKYVYKSTALKPNVKTQLQNMTLKGLQLYSEEKYEKAQDQFADCLTFANKMAKVDNRSTTKLILLLAKTHLKLNELHKALTYYHLALTNLIPKLDATSFYYNPKEELLYAENTLIDAFEGKAKVFELRKNHPFAIMNLELADKVSELLSVTYTNQEAQIAQQTRNRQRAEKLVDLHYRLYQRTQLQSELDKAFYVVEKSKARVLYNNIQYKGNLTQIQTDPLLQQRENLEKQNAILTKNIVLEETKEHNANIDYLKTQIARKTKNTSQLIALQQKINEKYPFLKDTRKTISIKKLQEKLLLEDHLLVSYFKVQDQWFVFSLTNSESVKVRVISETEMLENNSSQYIDLFFNGNDTKIANNVTTYQETAFQLYDYLLGPELQTAYKYLTIIPDKKLNFVAFDALLTKRTSGSNFVNYPYLVKELAINTGFSSAVLLSQKQNESHTTHKALGYFPVFKEKERDLEPLLYTLAEEASFKKFTRGTSLTLNNATKKHFLRNYKDHHNIHLSTHAKAGTLFQPASIEFYDETLYLPEIYGFNMQTDLLVLSACETGIGRMQKGEGLLSLARGFTYAGVDNLAVSLWKVNDKSTSELMTYFYKNLKAHSKTKAIQLAKLDYLNNKTISNAKKSPYYWASFVLVGNATADPFNYGSYIWMGVGLILLGFFFLKFLNKK